MAEITAHSPIRQPRPTARLWGWEVSTRPSRAGMTICDESPRPKAQLQTSGGRSAREVVGVGFGSTRREGDVLVVGSGPDEWMLLGEPATPDAVPTLADRFATASDGALTWVDQTHGRALVRVTGPRTPDLLAKLCAVDLDPRICPDGAALRSSVARLVTDLVRDDAAGEISFLLHCERSSGQYLYDCLADAGTEFGLEPVGLGAGAMAET